MPLYNFKLETFMFWFVLLKMKLCRKAVLIPFHFTSSNRQKWHLLHLGDKMHFYYLIWSVDRVIYVKNKEPCITNANCDSCVCHCLDVGSIRTIDLEIVLASAVCCFASFAIWHSWQLHKLEAIVRTLTHQHKYLYVGRVAVREERQQKMPSPGLALAASAKITQQIVQL